MKIGFFDSGVGGLTVLHEALKVLPHEDYIYFSDGRNAPYGVRSREEVRDLVFEAIEFIAQRGVKAIVVACNTATSVCIEELRARYDFPIIGMEPAVKPAVVGARKRVLVFATELTLRLEKFRDLVARVDTDKLVDFLPLQALVGLAERFEFSDDVVLPYLREKLAPYDLEQYGAVVLGCTHFPFFKDQIRRILPPHVQIVDGNRGTVNQLRKRLGNYLADGSGSVAYYLSGEAVSPDIFEPYLRRLDEAGLSTSSVEK